LTGVTPCWEVSLYSGLGGGLPWLTPPTMLLFALDLFLLPSSMPLSTQHFLVQSSPLLSASLVYLQTCASGSALPAGSVWEGAPGGCLPFLAFSALPVWPQSSSSWSACPALPLCCIAPPHQHHNRKHTGQPPCPVWPKGITGSCFHF
jgi:hypothetical protein